MSPSRSLPDHRQGSGSLSNDRSARASPYNDSPVQYKIMDDSEKAFWADKTCFNCTQDGHGIPFCQTARNTRRITYNRAVAETSGRDRPPLVKPGQDTPDMSTLNIFTPRTNGGNRGGYQGNRGGYQGNRGGGNQGRRQDGGPQTAPNTTPIGGNRS